MDYLSDHLGTYMTLQVSRMSEHGAYLSGADSETDEVLLPSGQVTEAMKKGSTVRVFIYKDSEDRLIATTDTPMLSLGEVALLSVADVTNIGAFLQWGLAKDLFLPFKEQTHRVHPGEQILVALYLDKSERLCATMHVYDYLEKSSPYKKNDHVSGRIYEITESFGAFVAVDDRYSALIPHNEMTRVLTVGEIVEARIKEVKDDGKLTLSLHEKLKKQMRSDADMIYDKLVASGGELPFHDKTSPEIIKREFSISKAAFKRAIGRLKRQGLIEINADSITLIDTKK